MVNELSSRINGHALTLETDQLDRYLEVINSRIGGEIQQNRGEETYRYLLFLSWLCKIDEEMERFLPVPISQLQDLLPDGRVMSSSSTIIDGVKIRMTPLFRPFVLELLAQYFLPNFKTGSQEWYFMRECCNALSSLDTDAVINFLNLEHNLVVVSNTRSILINSDFGNSHLLNKLFDHDIFTNTVAVLTGIINTINLPNTDGWTAQDEN